MCRARPSATLPLRLHATPAPPAAQQRCVPSRNRRAACEQCGPHFFFSSFHHPSPSYLTRAPPVVSGNHVIACDTLDLPLHRVVLNFDSSMLFLQPPFLEVSFAGLLVHNARTQLFRLRHPSFPRSLSRPAAAAIERTPQSAGPSPLPVLENQASAVSSAHPATDMDKTNTRPGRLQANAASAPPSPQPWVERWQRWLLGASQPLKGSPVSRILAVSDIHTDFKANMRWVEDLPAQPAGTHLIVAGTIGRTLLFSSTFSLI